MYLPMFSWHVFKANLLDLGLVSQEQLDAMKKECYTMRKEDPIGRRRSNNGAGWQSVDGVNDRPMFQSLLNGVEEIFNKEVFPFHCGEHNKNFNLEHGNYWVNINYQHGYNNVHTHPGCWYSGVAYISVPEETRGSGVLQFLSGQSKHMSNFIHATARTRDNFVVEPREGDVLLFPSAMQHYVEPLETDFDRISIAFNNSFSWMGDKENENNHPEIEARKVDDIPVFEVCPESGNLHFPK